MKRKNIRGACVVVMGVCSIPLLAYGQAPAAGVLKSEIAEAQNVQRTFADGLQHCAFLDGTRLYNSNQKRVILLSEMQTSLQNLVKDQVFNAQKKRLWAAADAEERMKIAQTQANQDKRNCNLVAKLPEMVKKLAEMESKR